MIKPETLSEISRDIAQVFFAAMVVESFVSRTYDAPMVTAGMVISTALWTSSLLLVRR